MADNKEILLSVKHLSQHFKINKAVDDVSFDIYKGEVFGLVGESGCGKTTTGRTIIKLYNATGGDVYFKGKRIVAGTLGYREAIAKAQEEYAQLVKSAKSGNVSQDEIKAKKAECDAVISEQKAKIKAARYDHKHCDKQYRNECLDKLALEHKQELLAAKTEVEKGKLTAKYKTKCKEIKKERLVTQIQMIFQDPIASLDPRMTVREIISEGLIIRGEDKKSPELDEKVYKVLERVGLVREHASRYPHEFSGGQRQRIGVARSVIMNPELIIADEPVSALDVSIQAQVINLLNELRHELGLTIMFIAHDLSVVKYFSDRIGVMYYGKMVELATSDELFAHPLHPYTRSLLSAIPVPDPVYEKKRKRMIYVPLAEHDYSVEKPTMREVEPGHFVLCNTAEYEKYQAELAK